MEVCTNARNYETTKARRLDASREDMSIREMYSKSAQARHEANEHRACIDSGECRALFYFVLYKVDRQLYRTYMKIH
jgi:hypothetical protein